jgi:PAS domain S-box-containing protein
MDAIKLWLAPPEFHGDIELTRRAWLINTIGIMCIAFILIVMVGALLGRDTSWLTLPIDAIACVIIILIVRWLRQGSVQLAGVSLVTFGLVYLIAVTASIGTIRTPTAAIFVFWVLMTGLIFGMRGILMGTSAALAAIAGLIVAENGGWLPHPYQGVGLTQWIVFTALFGFTSGLTYYIVHSTRKALLLAEQQIELRKKVEAELTNSEKRYRTLAEWSPEPVIVHRGAITLYVNPAAAKMFGADDPSQLIGHPLTERARPDSLPVLLACMDDFANRGLSSPMVEVQLLRLDGKVIDVELQGTAISFDGQPARYVSIRDVTAHKRDLAALVASDARWKFAIEGAGDGLWDWNIQTGKAFYSPRYKSMLGFAEEEIGDSADEWTRRIHPEDAPGVYAALQPYMEGKPGSATVEFRMLCKDGGWLWILGRGMVMERDDQGKPMRMIGTNNDITGRKLAEQALNEAKLGAERETQVKSRFLAAASHDLRQPIQAIGLFHHALQRTALNEEQLRLHNFLGKSVENLGSLLNSLLDISKLDARAVVPSFEAVQVKSLIQALDGEFWPLANSKSLRLKFAYPNDDLAVWADPKLLSSLLGNLMGNAIKYTERGGLLVSVRRRGNRALFQVWDTGIGIGPEHKEDIYEEYLQIGNPQRDRSKGLGLGLAIVKRLARLMMTDVTFRSQLKRGSVFEFGLPVSESKNVLFAVKQQPVDVLPSNLKIRRVVLVEDDDMVATALALLMESMGIIVERYPNAKEALGGTQDHTESDFYLTDLRLPDLNGLEFLQAVQQRSAGTIKAAILTGDTSPDRLEVIKSSRWPVLFKPIEPSMLLRAMEDQ